MPSWLVKAALQRAIGLLPGSSRINYFVQKHITGSVLLQTDWFEAKLEQCAADLSHHRRFGSSPIPQRALELGSGWHPIGPIAMALAGVERIVTVDIEPLLRAERLAESIRWLLDYADRGLLTEHFPDALPEGIERLRALAPGAASRDPHATLAELGITPLVRDARSLPLDAGTIELIFSHNTLEHVAAAVLPGIEREFRRVISDKGVMSHFIDMSDHYSHFDPSISNWHFLRYSDSVWRILDSPIVPQNRLRMSEQRRIAEDAGFRIVEERQMHARSELPSSVRLAERFRDFAVEDILITHAWMVAVPG